MNASPIRLALFAAISSLAEAMCTARMPTFSPEHRDDPTAFARGYFERLDRVWPAEHALVLDDIHCIGTSTAALLACAIDAFEGRRILCLASQLRPDGAFARHLAGSKLWVVGHNLLAFDAEEARLLADQVGADAPSADALVEATDGWAAGLMLAMQLGAGSDGSGGSGDPLETVRTPLAQLIAGQVLGGVARDDLVRLRLLAELPQVPMLLADLAPDWAGACARLHGLADRGLFVERLPADRVRSNEPSSGGKTSDAKIARINKGCWRLHDLFRNALREPNTAEPDATTLGADLVARLLETDRLDLAWQLAARLGGPTLDAIVISHGRIALRDAHVLAMRQLAAPFATRAFPRIALWLARALIGHDSDAALNACREGHAGHESDASDSGRALAASLGMLIIFSAIEGVGALAEWADLLGQVERADLSSIVDVEEHALRLAGEVVHDRLVGARSAGNQEATDLQDQLLAAVMAERLSPNESIVASSLLVAGMKRMNRLAEAELAIAQTEALASYERSAPHMRANWKIENGYLFRRLGALGLARDAYAAALVLAEDNALVQAKIAALIGLVRLELGFGRMPQAEEALHELDRIGAVKLGRQHGWVVHLQGRYAMGAGDASRALTLVDTARALLQQAGFTESATVIIEHDRIQILYALKQASALTAQTERVLQTGSSVDRQHARIATGLLEAHAMLRDEPTRSVELLSEHLRVAESLNLLNFLQLLPDVAGELASRALAMDVAAEFVRRAVRVRQLPAPRDAAASWPWWYRVEVLGTFRLIHDAKPVAFSGKTQQKPLELLKFLASERDLVSDFHSITDALWPDAEVQSARKNLEVTVSRLRKLLDDDSLVLVKEGKVALDSTRMASDAQEFTRAASDAESVHGRRTTADGVAVIATRLMGLFPSLPLEGEEPTAWREAVRERYRNTFVRAVKSLVSYWGDRNENMHSITLIEAALAREPLAEGLYQALIRIHLASGHANEAMRVYRQCRQMLSVLIGAQPSAETERLRATIQL